MAAHPPPHFDFSKATPLPEEDARKRKDSFGRHVLQNKKECSKIDFLHNLAPKNSTGQPFASAYGVVVCASDDKLRGGSTPVLKLSMVVCGIATSPEVLLDMANGYSIPTHKPPSDGEKVQRPRHVPVGEVNMQPCGSFLKDVSIIHSNPKGVPVTAADLRAGTHVKVSGITTKTGGFINARSVVVTREADDQSASFELFDGVFKNPGPSILQAMAAAVLMGGTQNILKMAPYLGQRIFDSAVAHRAATANALDAIVEHHKDNIAGEGQPWATPELECGAETLSSKAATLRAGDPFSAFSSISGATARLPLLFEPSRPWMAFPPSVQNLLTEDDAVYTTSPRVTSVETNGDLVLMYCSMSIGLNGADGNTALEFGQEPLLKSDGPVACIKRSLKPFAVDLDTRDSGKARMVVKEISPYCRMVAVAPAHFREWGDRDFADGCGGINFPDAVAVDVASGVRMAGLPVSREFCREYAGGDALIQEHVVETKDIVGPVTGPDSPAVVRLKTSGYEAISERTTNVNRLEGSRLPIKRQKALFFVVFEGCAAMLAEDPTLCTDLAKSEAAVREWASPKVHQSTSLDQVLLSETVLYCVAVPESDAADAAPCAAGDSAEAPPAGEVPPPGWEPAKKSQKRSA